MPSDDPPIADSASGQGQNSDPTDSSDPSIADSSSGQEQNSDPIDPGPSPAGPGSGQEQNSDPTAPSDHSFAVPVPGKQSLSGTVINPSSVVIAGSTIEAGASAVQIQGHQVSIGTAASGIVVDGTSTISLPADAPVSMNTVAGPTHPTTEAPDESRHRRYNSPCWSTSNHNFGNACCNPLLDCFSMRFQKAVTSGSLSVLAIYGALGAPIS